MSALFPGGTSLEARDYFVLASLFSLMLAAAAGGATAWRSSPCWRGSGEFFTAGRSLSWPIACLSLIAAEVSAIALLTLVASTYAGDWSALRLFGAAAAARLCVAWLYLPIVYPGRKATVYGYLGERFGPATQRACAGLFLGMRLLASGARLAAGAAVIGALLGCHPGVVIAAICFACGVYTSRGGLRAVGHAGAAQTAVILAAPVCVLAFVQRHCPGGIPDALRAAFVAGRLGLGSPRTAVALAPAYFAALATYGADQELAQNALAASSLQGARRAMIFAAAGSLIVAISYLAAGSGLSVFYRLNPGLASPESPALAFAHFVLTSLPPAARGLAAAALLMAAAHLPLCSLSAVFVEDFYRPWLSPRRSEAHYLRAARSAVWFSAAALGGLALVWSASEPWLAFLLKLSGMLLGPLLGVFLFGLFSRRCADRANVVALASAAGVGAVIVALIEAERLHLDPSWLIVSGALWTAAAARQLAPYAESDQ